MITIKVGLGQTPSGKILDRDTHFYSITATHCEKQAALDYHDETHKPIFISVSGKKYREGYFLFAAKITPCFKSGFVGGN